MILQRFSFALPLILFSVSLCAAPAQPAVVSAGLGLYGSVPVIIVDLSGRGLTSVVGLEKLQVQVTDFGTFPIRSLENVYLNFKNNYLGAASEFDTRFEAISPTIVGLDLSANGFKTIPTSGLAGLKQLRAVNLSENLIAEVKAVPWTTAIPETVDALNLSGNALTACPQGLPAYGKLRVLDLSFNKISDEKCANSYGHSYIPGTVEILNLQGNQLKTVPTGLPSYNKLRQLNLADNQIKDSNFLTSYGSSMLPTTLEELSLANNRLVEPPQGLYLMSSLKSLDLSFNQIKQHDFYGRYGSNLLPSALESLNLAGNFLSQRPTALNGLSRLRLVTLSEAAPLPKPFNLGEACPICLDVLFDKSGFEKACIASSSAPTVWRNSQGETVVTLECQHAVCKHCIRDWIDEKRSSASCPLCRVAISSAFKTKNNL